MQGKKLVGLLDGYCPSSVIFSKECGTRIDPKLLQTLDNEHATEMFKKQRDYFILIENLYVDEATFISATRERDFASRNKDISSMLCRDFYSNAAICQMEKMGNGVFIINPMPIGTTILYACCPGGFYPTSGDQPNKKSDVDFYGCLFFDYNGIARNYSAKYIGGISGFMQSLPEKDAILPNHQNEIAHANFKLTHETFVGKIEFPILKASRALNRYEQAGFDYMYAEFLEIFEKEHGFEVVYFDLEGKPIENGWQYIQKINLYDDIQPFDLLVALKTEIEQFNAINPLCSLNKIAELLSTAGKPLLDHLSAKEKEFLCNHAAELRNANVVEFRNERFKILYEKYEDKHCLAINSLGDFCLQFLSQKAVQSYKNGQTCAQQGSTNSIALFNESIRYWLKAIAIEHQFANRQQQRIVFKCNFDLPIKLTHLVKSRDTTVFLMNVGKALRELRKYDAAISILQYAEQTTKIKDRLSNIRMLINEIDEKKSEATNAQNQKDFVMKESM